MHVCTYACMYVRMHACVYACVYMVIIPFDLCKNIKWKLDVYEADGYSIKECDDDNRDKHVYIDEDLYYCNKLAKTLKMLLTMVFCVCKSQRLYRARGSTLRV